MLLAFAGDGAADFDAVRGKLDDCFAAVMCADAENDGYNALVLRTGLVWREVALVRTLSRYLRQIGVPFSQDYMWSTLVRHADLAAKIVALFETRFDPHLGVDADEREKRQADGLAAIEEGLEAVQSLDEDRILRHFVNAVTSALRTNYFQPSAAAGMKPIAIKFDSRKVDSMPLPRPRFEIFLCSPRLEAVHLRFGLVARGGIRWSDRPQDFRTEILGLVKAQQVKNAVIVPVGAKGGFVPKRLPTGNRDAIQSEGIAVYRLFMSTMLDITDNLDIDRVIPPIDVVRHDGDDPYLVVAADKGTATFSDIANEISRDHDFWLDDAFASGGSTGYDHKKMGDHRARRLGGGQAPFPRDERRHRGKAVHRGRRRRHVGRRVRQRHAARAHHQARRRFRSPRHLHRSRSRPRGELHGARAPVQPAALELAGLRPLT